MSLYDAGPTLSGVKYASLLKTQAAGVGAITINTGIPKTSLHRYLADVKPAAAGAE